MKAHRRYSAPTDRTTGIVCDQTIALDGHYSRQHYPERLRRIRFRDAETGKMLVFLTNNFDLPAVTIAALYKNRWQVAHSSPHCTTTNTGLSTAAFEIASLNFCMSGRSLCLGMFGMRSLVSG